MQTMWTSIWMAILAIVLVSTTGSNVAPGANTKHKVEDDASKVKKLDHSGAKAAQSGLGISPQLRQAAQPPSLNNIRAQDCADLLMNGFTESGIYEIFPFTCMCSAPVKVWCDMETDGGGWTVFLSRQEQIPRLNFNRSWEEYKHPFGNASQEHFIGTELLHHMTTSRDYTLRMDVHMGNGGGQRHAVWSKITVDDEDSRYRLVLGSYLSESTTTYNCLNYASYKYFSTYDRDSDSTSTANCAMNLGGGWWYYNCRYLNPTTSHNERFNVTCYNSYQFLDVHKLEMKIRPSVCNVGVKKIYMHYYGCDDCHANLVAH